MATKSIRKAILYMLTHLEKGNYERFCYELRNRQEKPKVPRSKVDGKDSMDITDVLVSTFTEAGALREALRILTEINCKEEADELVRETGGQSSTPGSSDTGTSSSGAAGPPSTVQVADFLKNFREDLVQRVTKTNVKQILDFLLNKDVIDQECYDTIYEISIPQDKVREIFNSIKTQRGKRVFYEILETKEPDLMRELKEKM